MSRPTKFTHKQLIGYKKKIHSCIHWLLIYKESDDYDYFNSYFESVLLKIESLNFLIGDQLEIINLYGTLASAYEESKKDNCNFKLFRKLIFDSHSILDKLDFGTEEENDD